MMSMLNLSLVAFCLSAATYVASNHLDPADDPNNIYRPCVDFNIDCIRDYFYVNSECAVSQGPVPDPLHISCYRVDTANINWTSYVYDVNVEGLNGDIVEFYVNTKTEKLVMAVEVHDLRLYSDNVHVMYLRKAKEALERIGSIDYKYDKVTMTAEFSTNCKLDLRDADIFTFIDDDAPDFYVGPGISANLDSQSQKQYQKYLDDASINLREIFVRQGAVFMSNYIQHIICDFGIYLDVVDCPKKC